MKSNQVFDISRFGRMLKAEVVPHRKEFFTGLLGLSALIVLVVFLAIFRSAFNDFDGGLQVAILLKVLMAAALFLGGLVFTSRTFSDLADSRKGHSYLGVPASHFEKYLSKWILTGPIYFMVVLVSVGLAAVLLKVILGIYPGYTVSLEQVFQTVQWKSILPYLFLHAQFLLGSIAFRKYAFFKTILSGFVSFFVTVILMGITMRIVFNDFFQGNFMHFGPNTFPDHNFNLAINSGPATLTVGSIFTLTVASIFTLTLLVVGYFKLTEREI